MAKYRIKEITGYNSKIYKIERKSIFGFWYNPLNIDAETTGYYYSLDNAIEEVDSLKTKEKSKVVKIFK